MGLDVTAYSKLRRLGHTCEQCAGAHQDGHEDHVYAYAFAVFPLSFRGIPIIGEREVRGTALIEGGCYEITDETELHDFRAGSYGGYNRWREELRRRFNPGQSVGEPFFELIYFADNEGCIGPEAAADLLADFEAHPIGDDDPLARPPLDRFAEYYRDWHHACRLAADSGLIRFH